MGSPFLTALLVSCLLPTAIINGARVVEEAFEYNINRRCRVDLPSCFPSQLDWAKLEDTLTGEVVYPGSSQNYTTFNFQYNKRTETYPLVHVMVRSAEDIRAAILFARRHNLRVTIKSSGSDFLGRSSAHSSFSINLMLMNDIEINNGTTPRSEYGEIKVQSGATWKDIYMEVDKYKRVIVGPGAQVVSAGGYTMGGGHSPLSPALGLAVDNVLEIQVTRTTIKAWMSLNFGGISPLTAELAALERLKKTYKLVSTLVPSFLFGSSSFLQVVLADGRISTCTENRTVHELPDGTEQTEKHGDLFWALRGGGGGTFGVVVYYVFKLHAAPESLVKVMIVMPFGDKNISGEVFKHYNKWTKRAPPSWGGYFTVDNYLQQSGQSGGATLFLIKLGKWDENTRKDLQEFFDLKERLPEGSLFWISNISSFWDYGKDLSGDYDPRIKRSYTMGTLLTAENHNADFGEFMTGELMEDATIPITCHWIRLGGKVNDFDVSSSSLHPGWRSALSCVSCNIGVEEKPDKRLETIAKQEQLKTSASGFAERLRHFGDGEYLNEADTENTNWKLDYWSYHHDELLRIKIRYDPGGVFFCRHCIGSTLYYNYNSMESSGSPEAAGRLYLIFAAMMLLMGILCL